LECAVAVSLTGLIGLHFDPIDLALVAQHAENDFVGAPSGAMDQLAAMCGRAGHALLINTSVAPPKVDHIGAHWDADGLALLVIDTRATHAIAGGEYARRRQECEQAAEQLGLDLLASAGPDAVLRTCDETLKAR